MFWLVPEIKAFMIHSFV